MLALKNVSRFLAVALVFGLGSRIDAQRTSTTVTGAVSVAAPDGTPLVMPGVTVTLTCTPPAVPLTDVTDADGKFHFTNVAVGDCSMVAELQGFKATTKVVRAQQAEEAQVDLFLNLDSLHEQVNVSADANRAQGDVIAGESARLSVKEMQTAPLVNERFQSALPLIPGVVRGPDGLLNINGSRSNQTGLRFGDANGTDPVTGEDAIDLPIDAVRSVQVRGTAYAPEYGQSAGAVTTVETHTGGDAWHFQMNNIVPRLRRRAGTVRGVESFTPRVTIGGPLVKGRLSALQSGQYELLSTRVPSLPALQGDTKLEGFDSFTRADLTITDTHHLTGSATLSRQTRTYAGLNTFNPQGVTPDIKNHSVLGTASDQILLGGNSVLETRVSVKQFDATIYPSLGRSTMILGTDVNSGSYFNDQDRNSRRIEWLSTYSFTPLGPSHLVKLGAGVTRESFDGTSSSRPVDIVRIDGTLNEEIAFVGSSALDKSHTSIVGYAQDTWTLSPRLTVEYGARYDRDSLNDDVNVAPRGSFTAVITGDGRTVLRGGVGMFYSIIPLNIATFDQLQSRVITDYAPDGTTIVGSPTFVRNIAPAAVKTPRSVVWNVETDREVVSHFFVRVGYQQRENRSESIVVPATIDTAEVLQLRDDGKSRYRQGQVTARYEFHGGDQIVGSYTRSSAVGNLNDFNSYFGNIQNPVIRPDERGYLPWDATNRLLLWTNVSLPHGLSVFPVLDMRTGFPASNIDENRDFVGARNSLRFPRFVSLDTQVTKRTRVFGHNATIGLKVFNITNHFNPRDYQGNLASAAFGGFYNSVGRTFRGKFVFEF